MGSLQRNMYVMNLQTISGDLTRPTLCRHVDGDGRIVGLNNWCETGSSPDEKGKSSCNLQ